MTNIIYHHHHYDKIEIIRSNEHHYVWLMAVDNPILQLLFHSRKFKIRMQFLVFRQSLDKVRRRFYHSFLFAKMNFFLNVQTEASFKMKSDANAFIIVPFTLQNFQESEILLGTYCLTALFK